MAGDIDKVLDSIEKLNGRFSELEKNLTRISQNFEDYKDARKALPEELREVQDRINKCNLECNHHTEETKSYFKKVDFLMAWYGRISAVVLAFQIVIAVMVFIGRYIDVQYTLK